MSDIIDIILNGIKECWQILENFEFLGTNMLTFSITLIIIGAMLPVLLTLVQNVNHNAEAGYREARRDAKRESSRQERKKGK